MDATWLKSRMGPKVLGWGIGVTMVSMLAASCGNPSESAPGISPSTDLPRAPSSSESSSESDHESVDEPKTTPDTDATAEESPLAWAPQVGDCYDYSSLDVDQAFATEGPVPCAQSHTSETYLIADWPLDLSPHAMSDSDTRQIAEPICLPLQGNAEGVFNFWSYFVPSPQQWQEGQRWLRCDGMVSLNDSQTAFAQWTGSVVAGEVREVLESSPAVTEAAPKWKSLPSPISNPTYVVLKRVNPQPDGSFLLTVDPLTPDFETGPDDACQTFLIEEPREGFHCLVNVTTKDRRVTLKPNSGIYFADSGILDMDEFMNALEMNPAVVSLRLDEDAYAESMLAVPMW